MNDYAIICPNCNGTMNDTNRLSTTVLNANSHVPGGEAYQYVYRCPTCKSTITWIFKVQKPTVNIVPPPDL